MKDFHVTCKSVKIEIQVPSKKNANYITFSIFQNNYGEILQSAEEVTQWKYNYLMQKPNETK